MRNYTAISIIRAQGCSGNNKSADYSSVDMGMKGKEGKMREKEIRGRKSRRHRERERDRQSKTRQDKRDAECANTHAFHWAVCGAGFPLAWQVSTTFVRPTYQLLS